MEEFAEYILNEEDLIAKEEIIYFLAPKLGINFDKATIFKTEIARMFLKYTKIRLDHNLILTACLLCNCKKVDDAQKIGKVQTYAIEGAQLLKKLGFDARFCKICEGVNRYSEQERREPESDILELVDQFGGMLLDRPERIGLNPDEALVLLEHRNLKNEYNNILKKNEYGYQYIQHLIYSYIFDRKSYTNHDLMQYIEAEGKKVFDDIINFSISTLEEPEYYIYYLERR